jgi:hypothetical protein
LKQLQATQASHRPIGDHPECWLEVSTGLLQYLPRPLRTGDRLVPACCPGFTLIVDQGTAPALVKADPLERCKCLVHVRAPYPGELGQ